MKLAAQCLALSTLLFGGFMMTNTLVKANPPIVVAEVLSTPILKFDGAKFEANLRNEFTDKDGTRTGQKGKIMSKGFAVVLIKMVKLFMSLRMV
jgi:hypothetical protein